MLYILQLIRKIFVSNLLIPTLHHHSGSFLHPSLQPHTFCPTSYRSYWSQTSPLHVTSVNSVHEHASYGARYLGSTSATVHPRSLLQPQYPPNAVMTNGLVSESWIERGGGWRWQDRRQPVQNIVSQSDPCGELKKTDKDKTQLWRRKNVCETCVVLYRYLLLNSH